MADKPQQQTLSVRITDAMRRRLERARQLAASKTGEAVSTSEIAKRFLESARDDRIEMVDLLAAPTESLLQIRRKGEAGLSLSRAEWTVLAHFAQLGVESTSALVPNAVARDRLVSVLDAFLAAYALRTTADAGLDAYYLGNLPPDCRPTGAKRSGRSSGPDRDTVCSAVLETRRLMSDASLASRPMFLARNLYVLLESDHLSGPEDLHRALRPSWHSLWRLAARGHYAQTERPVRDPVLARESLYLPAIPALTDHAYTLNIARGAGHDFSILLGFPPARGLHYPVAGVPRLAEFRTMVATLDFSRPSDVWTGAFFTGGVAVDADQTSSVWFRAHDNGITVSCTAAEWAIVQRLLRRAWELPDIRAIWDTLALEYGDL